MPNKVRLHPKAYLISKRNVRAGLISRSKILGAIENGRKSTSDIAKDASLSYDCVAYHLAAMRKDRVVDKANKTKPFAWQITPYGQQRLSTR
jgi:predicted transcriptional regulator